MELSRKLFRPILRRLPDEGRALRSAVHRLHMKSEIARSGLSRYLGGATLPPAQTVFWIDPFRIEFHTLMKNDSADREDWVFDQGAHTARVQGGDWDALSHRVADMRICRAMEDRIRHGASWASTDFYRHAVRQIESGQALWGCRDHADFDRRCGDIDRLVEAITAQGYREAAAIKSADRDKFETYGEVVVNLSRNGVPLFQDGRHRLAIARTLGLSRIPVQVFVRHAEWQTFREFMHRMARGDDGASRKGVLYQHPIHFDLGDIPHAHLCEDRWHAVEGHLDSGPGSALDIGCNLGFFCHRLAQAGYSCVGVESLPNVAMAAQKIAAAEGRNCRVLSADILDHSTLQEIGTSEFDVVMATNIFHHFIKTNTGYDRLRQLLGRIKIRRMFFEPHLPTDPQMQTAFVNPGPNEFVRLIMEWANLRTCAPIYTASDGRTIFKLDH